MKSIVDLHNKSMNHVHTLLQSKNPKALPLFAANMTAVGTGAAAVFVDLLNLSLIQPAGCLAKLGMGTIRLVTWSNIGQHTFERLPGPTDWLKTLRKVVLLILSELISLFAAFASFFSGIPSEKSVAFQTHFGCFKKELPSDAKLATLKKEQEQEKIALEAAFKQQQEEQAKATRDAALKKQQEEQTKAARDAALKQQQEDQAKAAREAALKQQQEDQAKAARDAALKQQQEEQAKAARDAALKQQEELEQTAREAALKQQEELEQTAREAALKQQEELEQTAREAALKQQQEDQAKVAREAALKQQQEDQARLALEAALKQQQEDQAKVALEAALKQQQEELEQTAREAALKQQEELEQTAREAALKQQQEKRLASAQQLLDEAKRARDVAELFVKDVKPIKEVKKEGSLAEMEEAYEEAKRVVETAKEAVAKTEGQLLLLNSFNTRMQPLGIETMKVALTQLQEEMAQLVDSADANRVAAEDLAEEARFVLESKREKEVPNSPPATPQVRATLATRFLRFLKGDGSTVAQPNFDSSTWADSES